jgi:hypothetical protein
VLLKTLRCGCRAIAVGFGLWVARDKLPEMGWRDNDFHRRSALFIWGKTSEIVFFLVLLCLTF